MSQENRKAAEIDWRKLYFDEEGNLVELQEQGGKPEKKPRLIKRVPRNKRRDLRSGNLERGPTQISNVEEAVASLGGPKPGVPTASVEHSIESSIGQAGLSEQVFGVHRKKSGS